MADTVYKIIELVGSSTESWEKATRAAVEQAAKSIRDIRVAEVVEQDVSISGGKIEFYRVKLKVSFKYEASKQGFSSESDASQNTPQELALD